MTRSGPLLLALLLAGCAGADLAPFGRRDLAAPPDSLTVRRVTGQADATEPLRPEPGNVWPAEEARRRATLMDPDAPASGPDLLPPSEPVRRARRERGAPPEPRLRAEQPGPEVPPERAPNPRRPPPVGSSNPPGVLPSLDPEPVPRAGVPRGEAATPPAPRRDGRVVPVPGGPPATLSGGAGGTSTFLEPGGRVGTAIEQGGTTTLIGPDGTVRTVPTPR